MFQKAREGTKKYHTNLYKTTTLFAKGSWLEKPEPDIIHITCIDYLAIAIRKLKEYPIQKGFKEYLKDGNSKF